MAPAMAHEPPPPLQQKLQALHCAKDAKMAQKILKELAHITAPGQKWPDEWMGQKPEASLHAGMLDIALYTLKSTAERFPNLREEAERIALQWDYCDVLENQHFYDLILRQKKLHKMLTANDAPLKWKGFYDWGFLTPDPAKRFVPKLLDEIRIAPEAYHLFLHEVYRKRCFPHPETGLLVSEAESPPAAVANHALALAVDIEETAQAYPFKWDNTCQIETPSAVQHNTHKTPATANKAERKKQRDNRQVARQQRQQQRRVPLVAQAAPHPSPTLLPPAASGAMGASGEVGKGTVTQPTAHAKKPDAAKALALVPQVAAPATPQKVFKTAKGEIILPTIVSTTAGGDIPIYFEDAPRPQAHSTTGIVDSKKKSRRIAVTVADTVSLKNGSNNLAVSATWSPKKDWFVNGSASVKDGKPGYAWNVGYSNPKPGTVSVQVGNTGPIAPGKGLDVKNASASIGYKVNSEKLAQRKLSASGGVNISAKGKAKANATMQWNPKPNVYARTTASAPVDGGKPSWSYAAGYSSSKAGGLRVEYSNYGNNKFPGDNLKDGAITVSHGWQF